MIWSDWIERNWKDFLGGTLPYYFTQTTTFQLSIFQWIFWDSNGFTVWQLGSIFRYFRLFLILSKKYIYFTKKLLILIKIIGHLYLPYIFIYLYKFTLIKLMVSSCLITRTIFYFITSTKITDSKSLWSTLIKNKLN